MFMENHVVLKNKNKLNKKAYMCIYAYMAYLLYMN